MSINSHLGGFPSGNDDIENMIYTLLFLSELGLTLHPLSSLNKSKHTAILKIKLNFYYVVYCEKDYQFLDEPLNIKKK